MKGKMKGGTNAQMPKQMPPMSKGDMPGMNMDKDMKKMPHMMPMPKH